MAGTPTPLKVVSLRRSCLEDLKKTKELHEDGVLSEEEFEEENKRILDMLRGLGKQIPTQSVTFLLSSC